MRVKTCVATAALLTLVAPAVAQTTNTAVPTATATPVVDKKICHSEVATGSIMGTRICHTRSEWAAINAANAAATQNLRDHLPSGGVPH